VIKLEGKIEEVVGSTLSTNNLEIYTSAEFPFYLALYASVG